MHRISLRRVDTAVCVAAGFGLAVLVLLSTQSLLWTVVALVAAAFVAALAALGAERLGTLFLMGAFATAPMYKGLAPSPGSPVTATDVLFVIGFGLLFFRLVSGRPRAHPTYWIGNAVVLATGLLAAVTTPAPGETLLPLAFWMSAMVVLPVALSMWNPSGTVINCLAWSYVAGQIFDTGYALADNGSDRWTGLSTHPNYFAEGALLSCALLIFLEGRLPVKHRWVVWVAAAICGVGVINSGSRAATVVLAVLILLIPFLERTAKAFTAVAGIGGLATLIIAFVLQRSGENSALDRLTGAGSALGSDLERQHGLTDGWHRFLSHPLLGNGMGDLFDIHNNLLEVAVAIGVFGLFGYLLVMWGLGRILVTDLPLRRLGYVVLAYLGFGATIPSLYDRSIWSVVSLSVLAYQAPRIRSALASHSSSRSASQGREPTKDVVPSPG